MMNVGRLRKSMMSVYGASYMMPVGHYRIVFVFKVHYY